MRDLLIITPTRGRPGPAQRLIDAVAATATQATDLIFAIDDDDDSYTGLRFPENRRIAIARGPRATCGQWTNRIAALHGEGYRALASFGDDHLPRTHGWDSVLLDAIDASGGCGIAYGDDIGQGKNLPTAPVISTEIVAALGWMFLPTIVHFFADNAWLDLGREAGCLMYMPDVVIEHLHWTRSASPKDATYEDARGAWPADELAYRQWRHSGLPGDVAKIRALRSARFEHGIRERM